MPAYRNQIHKRIVANADEKVRDKCLRLVPGAKVIGVTVPKLRALVAEFRREHADMTLDQASDLMDDVCRSRCREEILFGLFLLGTFGKRASGIGWERIARWTNALDNWETCDQLASQVSGGVVAANLELVDQLVELCGSKNPWKRRFALATVSELNHKGRVHPDEALRVSELLLTDSEPTVKKAVGWTLKETSKKAPNEVFQFLLTHRAKMPAAVLREASEKLSPEQKRRLSQS